MLASLVSRPKPVMEALSLMASIEIASGRYDEAMVQLRRAIALYPGTTSHMWTWRRFAWIATRCPRD